MAIFLIEENHIDEGSHSSSLVIISSSKYSHSVFRKEGELNGF